MDASVINNQTQCLEDGLLWVNSFSNWDNVGNAYLSLFQVATFKGWVPIMERATDTRDVSSPMGFGDPP